VTDTDHSRWFLTHILVSSNPNETIRHRTHCIWSEPPGVEFSYRFDTAITESEYWNEERTVFPNPVRLKLIFLPLPSDFDNYCKEDEYVEVSGKYRDILRTVSGFYKGPQYHDGYGLGYLLKTGAHTYSLSRALTLATNAQPSSIGQGLSGAWNYWAPFAV
jgi:hypothetical protein